MLFLKGIGLGFNTFMTAPEGRGIKPSPRIKKENIVINDMIAGRANEIQKHGLKPTDSLHFAFAEYRNVNVLLTVDKEFVNNSKRINSPLRVVNPINWFTEEIANRLVLQPDM